MITAQLDEEQLERLERQLQIDLVHLTPGSLRSTREVAGEVDQVVVPERMNLEEAAKDLLDFARSGVRIAPQTESRPLVPLYEARGLPLPPEIRVDIEKLRYAYYLVELTFTLMLADDLRPLSADFGVRLDDDVADQSRRLRATQLFPDRADAELFRADVEGQVGLDANMRIGIPEAVAQLLPVGAPAGEVEAGLKAQIVVGPFSFPFRKAKIEVAGVSDQDIVWRYRLESALWGANVFKSIIVVKIAEEAGRAELGASLSVVPYKRKWAVFKERLPALKAASRSTIELVREKADRQPAAEVPAP